MGEPSRRWKCLCAYDGTDFDGWQSQSSGRAIQDIIETRLAHLCKRKIRIHGSGRTDAGVHALGQVFHFDAAWRHPSVRMQAALKAGLPPEIQITAVELAPPDFHARFSARGKRYSYRIVEGQADPFGQRFVLSRQRSRPLDLRAMTAAAAILRGRHDFSAFAAASGTRLEMPVRELDRLDIEREGTKVRLVFEANGFLYKMVRSLTGMLLAVGEGRMSVAEVRAQLESRRRTQVVETAPARGLFLERVFY